MYDIQWKRIKGQREAKRREAEDAETERRRAAEATSSEQRERKAWQERLRPLEQAKYKCDSDIFELNRSIRKLSADLNRLRDQDDQDLRKDTAKNSWWTYLTAPVYEKANETEEQVQQRRTEAVHRRAVKSVKEHDLGQKEAKLRSLESELRDLDRRIAAEREKFNDEQLKRAAKRQEQLRKEQEVRRREEEQRRRAEWAKWEVTQATRRRKEAAARAAKEAREAEEAAKAKERERAARESLQAREAMKAKERAQASREAEAARKKATYWRANTSPKYSKPPASTSLNKDTCRHNAFWPKLQGSHLRSNCNAWQNRFALQCPGCNLIAYVDCRKILKR